MNPNTMPSWLIDYLEENTGFSRPGKFGYPYYTATSESDAVVYFYKFISKPENLVKIPKVAKLVEANNKQVKCGFAECSECASEIKEALAPFFRRNNG